MRTVVVGRCCLMVSTFALPRNSNRSRVMLVSDSTSHQISSSEVADGSAAKLHQVFRRARATNLLSPEIIALMVKMQARSTR